MTRRWFGAAIALVVLGGCSDDGGGAAPMEEAPLELSAYCEVFYEALCERQVGCNVALVNQATTVQECMTLTLAQCEPELGRWTPSVEAGRALFDPEALAACRDGMPDMSCKELVAGVRPEACSGVFVGTVADGEPCYVAVECEELGGACATLGRCPSVCESPTEPPDRFDCSVIGCPDGQYCNGNLCEETLPLGASCREMDACDPGLFCGRDVNASTLECRAKKAAGEVCFSRASCQDGFSCQPTGTDVGSTCASALGEGAPCTDTEQCAVGLICDQVSGLCGQPREEQQECFGPFDCADGLYCWDDPLFETGSCREQAKVGVAQGEPCNPVLDRCRLGLFCRRDVSGSEVGECALLPELGEGCADFPSNLNEECRVGECAFIGGTATCIELLPDGAPCESREQCISGACPDGACQAYEEVNCGFDSP